MSLHYLDKKTTERFDFLIHLCDLSKSDSFALRTEQIPNRICARK
ncbi:unnamed protein product [Amoebophrya sp. A25]|nr:unnamed protein product [Amoebophrya sp. A25]|eukprot:GSA25T00005876001.1